MAYVDPHPPYFVCLCSAEQQPALRAVCAASGYRVEFVETIETLLKVCLEHPPLGLILEIGTSIRIGAERMSNFLNLGVNWPVMRCAVPPDGEARVMCFEPPHGEPLLGALDGIAAGDPSWQHPRFKRRHLRLNMPGRARVRLATEARWRLGNLDGISCGGAFIMMTSDAPPLREELEIELVDFQPLARVRGRAVRLRAWEDGLLIPGVGIEFDPASIDDGFRAWITKSPSMEDLLADP
jgi:hypothetical protein